MTTTTGGHAPQPLPLSVLELAPVVASSTPAEALAWSTEIATLAESLGYRRFWVAEHHNTPGVASSVPAVLLAHVAAATSTIRVGSGGVMLSNHAPLSVAEQFGMLEALHPGRIDLGLGRAPGTDQLTAAALRRTRLRSTGDEFPGELAELLAFFDGTFPEDHPYAAITPTPAQGYRPAIWILGSSQYGAVLAGTLGLPYCFAHHFSPGGTDAAMEAYHSTFRPSAILEEPYAMVAASVLCAPDDDEAAYLAGPSRLSGLRIRTGRRAPLPSPEEAAAYPFSEQELALIASFGGGQIVGSPERVAEGLHELARRTGAKELMVTTSAYDVAHRKRSFSLVAAAMGLERPTGVVRDREPSSA